MEPWTSGATPPQETPPQERVLTRAPARAVLAVEIVTSPALPLWMALQGWVIRTEGYVVTLVVNVLDVVLLVTIMRAGRMVARGYVTGGLQRPSALRQLAEAGGLPVRTTRYVMHAVLAASVAVAVALLVHVIAQGPPHHP